MMGMNTNQVPDSQSALPDSGHDGPLGKNVRSSSSAVSAISSEDRHSRRDVADMSIRFSRGLACSSAYRKT